MIEYTKVQKMLLGIAIGDAYGVGYEFVYKNGGIPKEIDFTKYSPHPNPEFNSMGAGNYTDDTQMSISVYKLLMSQKEFNKRNLADNFVNFYWGNPIDGYARGFQSFLNSVKSGKEFLEKIKPYSERNGAAMRSVPLGLIIDSEKVVEYAKVNASVTHNTPKGIDSSVFVGLTSHYSFYQDRLPNLEKEIIPYLKDSETIDYLRKVSEMNGLDKKLLFGEKYEKKGVPCDGMRTAGAVQYILSNFSNPSDVLQESVKLGGDTDSVASISLGINLMNNSISDLPEFLFNDLVNSKYGRDYLIKLGRQL